MDYTVLVYEEVPEECSLYLIPNDVADQYREFLEKAHAHYTNTDGDNEGTDFLNIALEAPAFADKDKPNPHSSIFVQYKQEKDKPIIGQPITHVYVSGFVL